MAFFGITIETIKTAEKHPNADKLSVCTLEGLPFTFVTGLDLFKVGESVIYVPIDAIVPDSLAEKLGVLKKLSGKNKDRVKTCTIRGTVSQGIVGKFSIIEPFLVEKYGTDWATKCIEIKPSEITEWLGVTKYEPPTVLEKGGILLGKHVEGVPYYDIESTDRYSEVVNILMDMPVLVTSKVEGSNHYCGITKDGNFVVGQRSGQILKQENGSHTWWTTAEKTGFLDIAKRIQTELFPNKQVIMRQELTGGKIQGNYYNFTDFKLFCFDIMVDDKYLSAQDFLDITSKYNIQTVPILSVNKTLREFLNGKTIDEASTYTSKLVDKLEEGIVIKPMTEQYNEKLGGRLMLKKRSTTYLAQSDF